MIKFFIFFSLQFVIFTNSISLADWTQLPTGSSSYLTSVFFMNAETGYIGGQDGYLAKTTNGGSNWQILNPNMPSAFVRDISFPNENTGYICGDNGIIRKTTNGGINWTVVSSGNPSGIYSIDAIDQSIFFATATNGSVIKSTDGGISFNQFSLTSNQLLALDFISSDTGFVSGQGGVVYKTYNGGQSWIYLDASTLNNFWDIFALNGSDIFLSAYYGTLRKSADGGQNFTNAFAPNKNFEGMQMLNERIGYVCGLDGVIGKTTNGGFTWYFQNSNTSQNLNEVYFLNSQTGYTVGSNGTVLKTTDGGDNFQLAILNPYNREVLISGSQYIIKWSSVFEGNVKIEFSDNGGISWGIIQNSVPANAFEYNWNVNPSNSNFCKIRITSIENPLITDVSEGSFTVVGSNPYFNVPDLVYYKFNNGINTTPNYAVPGEVSGAANITGMSLQQGGIADSCLAGAGGNGAENFVNTNWATYLNSSGWTIGFWVSNISLGVNPNNAVYLFSDITANNLRCYYGGAGGLTAKDTAIMFRLTGLQDVRIPVVQGQTYYIHIVYESDPSSIKIYKNGILVQTELRTPFLCIGNGPLIIGAYATFNSSLSNNMRLDEFRIYSRTLGQTEISQTWNTTINTIITGLSKDKPVQTGDGFFLHDNYPNPFNPSTKISFQLPGKDLNKSYNVNLAVYDILGRLQNLLLDQNMNAGNYSVDFNAEHLSGGVYFYRLTAFSDDRIYEQTKKMLLIK